MLYVIINVTLPCILADSRKIKRSVFKNVMLNSETLYQGTLM